MNTGIIRKNFSRAAHCYDRYAVVQDRCSERLIALVRNGKWRRILEIGCGTGTYTARLRAVFPPAAITAVDVSAEMVAAARKRLPGPGVEFIVADAQTFSRGQEFDLITSNATLQWLPDPERALRHYRDMLFESGRVVFSLFGSDTFSELSTAVSLAAGRDTPLSSRRFFSRHCLQEVMERVFCSCRVQEEIIQEEYPGVRELLRTIKYSGTRGQGIAFKGLLTPRFIDRLETVYRREFGGVVATYHVLFCEGRNAR